MAMFGRHRMQRPVEGHAEIVQCWQPPKHGANGNCKMKLRLDVPGVEPQIVDYHEAVMVPNRWPEVGMRVAVTVDAKHPDRVEVHWESVFGEVRGGIFGVAAEQLASVVGADIDLSKGPPDRQVPQGRPPADYPQRVDELNARFRAGEITYEQMAAELQRLMTGQG